MKTLLEGRNPVTLLNREYISGFKLHEIYNLKKRSKIDLTRIELDTQINERLPLLFIVI